MVFPFFCIKMSGYLGNISKNTKRYYRVKRKILITSGIILLIIVLYINSCYANSYIRQMVEPYEMEYISIAKIYYEDYQKNPSEYVAYSDGRDGEIYRYTEPEHKIILDEEHTKWAHRIEYTYELYDKNWSRVYVYDGFVSFSNILGMESIVYSVDGSKPQYVNMFGEKVSNVKVKKITDNLYYVYGKR